MQTSQGTRMAVFPTIGYISIMDFINTLKERHRASRKAELEKAADEVIAVTDFDDQLYIGFEGIPLVLIDDNWTIKDILETLSNYRRTYVQSRLKYG